MHNYHLLSVFSSRLSSVAALYAQEECFEHEFLIPAQTRLVSLPLNFKESLIIDYCILRLARVTEIRGYLWANSPSEGFVIAATRTRDFWWAP